ncbi:hypothetical protein [Ligilactobacillus ruminis]|nr:hypothetical protein [Ligilactobacillus ruminis]
MSKTKSYIEFHEAIDRLEEAIQELHEIIYVFLTIFLYLLKCPQSLIL